MHHSTSFNDHLATEIHEMISWISFFMLGGFSILKSYCFHVVPIQTVSLLETATFRNAKMRKSMDECLFSCKT